MTTTMMNKKNYSVPITLFVILFMPFLSLAQDEQILPLQSNGMIKAALMRKSVQAPIERSATMDDTLYLPFFDDFANFTVWPSPEKWVDSTAFINYNFPLNPPTLGVATFDGLDAEGNAYVTNNANASGLCDVMTSRYINLAFDENGLPYNVSDSIALIFYYQRRGRGDNPESTDSLTLQFYDPALQTWNSVWKATGNTSGDTDFTKVKISINDPIYRQNGFRFRFRNYGAQTGILDIWNVDYVYLNKFLPPDYEVQRDYAFVYEGISLLKDYSAVPWPHFTSLSQTQQEAMVRTSAELTMRNNNDASPFPVKVAGVVYDQFGNPTPIVGGGGLNNIVIPLNTNTTPPASLLTSSVFNDPLAVEQAVFTAVYDLGSTAGGQVDDFPANDTLRYIQNFHDHYAYDDGSAELAYGINGIGAQLAYKFEILKGDTLRAVNMFFTQSGASVSNQLFRIAVWSGNSNGPVGTPVYQKYNQTPIYIDSINGFHTYQTDPVYLPAGTWFFGFIQNNAVLLNLGLDVNTPADPSKKFINTTGSWVNSSLPGMWMIRPVFSGEPLYTGVELAGTYDPVSIYPNPASTVVHLKDPTGILNHSSMTLFDNTGRIISVSNIVRTTIDVSGLPEGFYYILFSNSAKGKSFGRKIVIAR